MNASVLIVPILVLGLLVYGLIKKINCYRCFIDGSKQAVDLIFTIFPYLVAIFLAIELMKISGLTTIFSAVLSPLFYICGIPTELSELIVIRPFSGSGSLAVLESIYSTYGTDSYIADCASIIIGSTDSIFYIATIYFAGTNTKKLLYAIPVAIICTVFTIIVSCFIARFI